MITDALLSMAATVIDWFLGMLPAWPVQLPGGLADLVRWMKGFDEFVPVTEVTTVLGLTFTLVGAYTGLKWTLKLVDWIMDVIP